MSNSKQKSKKRRLSDSDSSQSLPNSKRQKISHPSNNTRNNILNRMDQDVENNNIASLVSSDQNQKQNQKQKNTKTTNITNININAAHFNHSPHFNHINNSSDINNNNSNNNNSNQEIKEEKEISPKPNGIHGEFINMSPSTTTPQTLSIQQQHPPQQQLLFENDHMMSSNITTNININNNNTISTPMGFNLSEPEIISVLLQYLDNAGYHKSVDCLSNESGIPPLNNTHNNYNKALIMIKQWILNGNWEALMDWFNKFKLSTQSNNFELLNYYITAQDLFYSKVLILEQKFLELIYQNAKVLATEVMNKELIPLVSPNSKKIFKNIGNLHMNNNHNFSDIQLLSQLTNTTNNNRSIINNNNISHIPNIPMIEMDININNNMYPIWRWNKLCKLLYIGTNRANNNNINNNYPNLEVKTELNSLNWYNITDSRQKLYNEIIHKLRNKHEILLPNNNTLLNIFDQFIKCQLLQSNHFNLQNTTNISLTNNNSISQQLNIPSETYYILKGHSDEITHLSFSNDGQWLISSSNDKRTLIWDFNDILHCKTVMNKQINIIYDILHYQSVIIHKLSPNKKYLITITEQQPGFDDFKHYKDRKNYIRRENNTEAYTTKPQFKYTHYDQSHNKYYDYNHTHKAHHNMARQTEPIMMDTERGSNIYLWKLDSDNEHKLYAQYHHYKREASICWCPDSKYYFITSYGNDIDLYNIETGDIICTLPCNGNLMTDLLLTHHGYRLCVTLNSRDVRVYITDFNVHYNALKRYNKYSKKRKLTERPPKFVPWLHFTHKNYINLFQNNISSYITKCLYNRNDNIYKWNNSYNDLTEIAKQSTCNWNNSRNDLKEESENDSDNDYMSDSLYSSNSNGNSNSYSSNESNQSTNTDIAMEYNNKYKYKNRHMEINKYNNNQSMLSETESLESMDDKLWILYEENLDLDKKSNGQLKNDIIVSTNVSYGGEHEYLIIMVHQFIINKNIINNPIILMIDLRNINFNINYNNSDLNNNNRNIFNIKCFYGFKQNRFKLQCGFGGFQLPPISNKAFQYQQTKYKNMRKLKNSYQQKMHQTQKELKTKLNPNSNNLNYSNHSTYKKKRNKTRKCSNYKNENKINNQNLTYPLQFKLNKNELRNLRIPFVQSLQCENLSNLQNEINQRVSHHYVKNPIILSTYKRNKNKTKIKNKNKNKKKLIINNINHINEENNNNNNKELMIENMIKIALKYPKFLPTKIIQDLCINNINEAMNESDINKIEPIIYNLFNALPFNILNNLYKFMQNKVQMNKNKNNNNTKKTIGNNNEIKKVILEKEILNAFKYTTAVASANENINYEQLDSGSSSTAISSGSLNSLSQSLNSKSYHILERRNNKSYYSNYTLTKYNKENLKKKCFQLKEKRDKFNSIQSLNRESRNNNNINENNSYGRSHYLYQKYIRQQIVNDNSDLNYFTQNIDKLLLKYSNANIEEIEKWTHLSMEMKYFIWHQHLKHEHYNKMQQENYHKISKKKKKKKLKKLQSMNIQTKIRSAIKKKKKNNHSFGTFLDETNQTKKRKKRRHKLDKSRRSNEDIQIETEKNEEKEEKKNEELLVEKEEKKKEEIKERNEKNNNKRKEELNNNNYYYSSSDDSNNANSDINEYVSAQNTSFVNDELNDINISLYPGYNKNKSIHKLDLNEMETISQLINNKKCKNKYIECGAVSAGARDNNSFDSFENSNSNSLIQDEYILNDFFGGHHFIVSGSEDGNVCIWNRITQKIIKLCGHTKSVNCVAWNPIDSFMLVSGSDDTQIRVWGPNKT